VQSNRKTVHAWAFAGDWEPGRPLRANTFEIEWPPGSGRLKVFPEADRGEFVAGPVAERKLIPAQRAFVGRLQAWLNGGREGDGQESPLK
jgi:predicted NUDIX family NTP pyrophosphohydrolase